MVSSRLSLIPTSLALATVSIDGFTFLPSETGYSSRTSNVALKMGIFDGIKDAFNAPAVERSVLDADRETPIDRWMGWNARTDEDAAAKKNSKGPKNFIDSMDEKNYFSAGLEKPMGVVFEENDEEDGGIFVLSIKEGGNAEKNGVLKPGDQLVAVGTNKVAALDFDQALSAIVECEDVPTKLVVFRGGANMLYGPTGASQEWLDQFIAGPVPTSES